MFRVLFGASAALTALIAAPTLAQSPPQAQAAQPIARAVFISNMDSEFRKMDADKDGRVTAIEMQQFRHAVSVTQGQERNRRLFAQLDADRNGQISPAEFARMVVPVSAPNVAPQMARFDLDRDKAISLVEYRTGTLANFDKLDTDKDGYVSVAEMKAGGIGN